MGWIATAIDANGESLLVDDTNEFKDSEVGLLFQNAVLSVRELTSTDADPRLQYGGLESAGAIEMLQRGTSAPVPESFEWTSGTVQTLQDECNWNFPVNHSSLDEYWSARMFLEICADNEFKINFEIV